MTLSEQIDAARIEWERWEERFARNRVKSTADWWLFQRAKDEYGRLLWDQALANGLAA